MTPEAFVLIEAEVGKEEDTLKDVKKVEGVKEAYPVYGRYDIIARVYGKDKNELNKRIINYIRKLDCIRTTVTMEVVEGFSKEKGDYKP